MLMLTRGAPPARPPAPHRVPALSDWQLMLAWAQHGKAEAHFGEAGVTNLLHTLRDALAKATGSPVRAGAGAAAAARGGARGERAAAQAQARQDATLALMKELAPLLRKLQTDPAQVRGRGRAAGLLLQPSCAEQPAPGRRHRRCTHVCHPPMPASLPPPQAAALAGLVPELKLEVFALKRAEKGFAQLAGAVKDAFLKHADAQVRCGWRGGGRAIWVGQSNGRTGPFLKHAHAQPCMM